MTLNGLERRNGRYKDFLFPVSLPPFSCPYSLEYLRPRALILLKTWRYISRLLTYSFTYCVISLNLVNMRSKT